MEWNGMEWMNGMDGWNGMEWMDGWMNEWNG